MALIAFNTARTSVSGQRAIYVAGTSDSIIFGRSAFWTATHINALEIVGYTWVQVSGEIYANSIAILVDGTFNTIAVNRTGVVYGESKGIVSNDGSTAISNAGSISGYFGIEVLGSNNNVFNEGTIIGQDDAVRFFAFTGTTVGNSLTNIGQIVSHFADGVTFSGGQSQSVTNSGVIDAAGRAISAGTVGALAIDNSGTVRGNEAIRGGSGIDRVLNTGTLIGTVALGDGDDNFDSSQGVVNGNIRGDGGNDTLYGGLTDDVIDGGTGEDILVGNAGNDRLTGGTGADDLDGGAGVDGAQYALSITSVVADLAGSIANAGDAFGDTFANIENLLGSAFGDFLYGDADANRLNGGAGDDLLDGRAGTDVLAGGTGSDRLVVDSVRDRVVELSGEGTDTVVASIAYTLGVYVENLTLTGTAALAGTGNSAGNVIVGNSGVNLLDGLLGSDVLTGGAGADQFRFTTALDDPGNIDTITDFTPGTDRIALNRTIFTTLGGSVAGMQAGAFVSGTAAGDANDRIVYDSATGEIFFDSDGTGALVQTLFARVDPGLVLTAADFIVYG